MAFEQRNGTTAYYRKKRIGDRVVSEYCGTGLVARFAALEDELRRDREAAERARLEADAERDAALENLLDEALEEAICLSNGLYLASGYRQHSRTWRRKRNFKDHGKQRSNSNKTS